MDVHYRTDTNFICLSMSLSVALARLVSLRAGRRVQRNALCASRTEQTRNYYAIICPAAPTPRQKKINRWPLRGIERGSGFASSSSSLLFGSKRPCARDSPARHSRSRPVGGGETSVGGGPTRRVVAVTGEGRPGVRF